MSIFDEALKYSLVYGFSVIPERDKQPLIEWTKWKTEQATKEQIQEWWKKFPDANIGIITGKISNLAVIDVDTDEALMELNKYLPDNFECPMVQTPGGGRHFYCRWEKGLGTYQHLFGDIELKGEGGKITAPPSIGENGKPYEWIKDYELGKLIIPSLPKEFINAIKKYKPMENHHIIAATNFTLHRRNEDLYHVARVLAKGKMPKEEALAVIQFMAANASPPYPSSKSDSPIQTIVESAYRKERNLPQEIRSWVNLTEGWFNLTIPFKDLQILTTADKNNAYVIFNRLCKEGILEHHPSRNAVYRLIKTELQELNWKEATVDFLDIDWPLDLNTQIKTTPGDIIIIAGESDSGKTAFALDFIVRNHKKYKINYFSSQLGESKLKQRLEPRTDVRWQELCFKAWNKMENFVDVLFPDEINIIDFLMVTQDFWIIGDIIKNIHKKIKGHKGIALVCIQKSPGKEYGRGGDLSLDLAELYITFERGGIAKILKAKNWLGKDNPNYKVMRYKIIGGWNIIPQDLWHRQEDEKLIFNKKRFIGG